MRTVGAVRFGSSPMARESLAVSFARIFTGEALCRPEP